jgi:hypothetical protein
MTALPLTRSKYVIGVVTSPDSSQSPLFTREWLTTAS